MPPEKKPETLPTKERIFQTAAGLYASKGYRGTSMRDLAREVGIKESSLYNHFPGKEALLHSLLAFQAKEFQRAVENLPSLDQIPYGGKDPVELWLLGVGQFVTDLPPVCESIARILTNEMYLEPLCTRFLLEVMFPAQRRLTETLLRGLHRRGLLPPLDFEAEAALYVNLVHGLEMENRLRGLAGEDPQILLKNLFDSIARYLRRLSMPSQDSFTPDIGLNRGSPQKKETL